MMSIHHPTNFGMMILFLNKIIASNDPDRYEQHLEVELNMNNDHGHVVTYYI